MTDKPILFNGEMVRATLADEKGCTRRIVKGSEDCEGMDLIRDRKGECFARGWWSSDGATQTVEFEPLVQPGHTLWVREAWYCDDYRVQSGPYLRPDDWTDEDQKQLMYYRERDHAGGNAAYTGFAGETMQCPWKPSIHMPRWASRITLEVTGVRIEKLQEMNRGDAMAEGCPFPNMAKGPNPLDWFKELWDGINGKGSWAANPWVWVYEFKRVKQP